MKTEQRSPIESRRERRTSLTAKILGASCGVLVAATTVAQVLPTGYVLPNANVAAANAAFPLQNLLGPSGKNYQVNYPYPGQCLADPINAALFPTLPACSAAPNSFACPGAAYPGVSNQSAGGWSACGAPFGFKLLSPQLPALTTPKFVWEMLNPPDYTPATSVYPGADYYELAVHEAWGFQALAGLGAFPNPLNTVTLPNTNPISVPNGMQWTGLTCTPVAPATTCTCPAGLDPAFQATYCPGGTIPAGAPLFTPIWGVGQKYNPAMGQLGTAGLGAALGSKASPWSPNDFIATWPSISVRGTKGTPVVVKWVNEFPNNHVLCTHPDAADWPCSIDRTFMGVKARIDPAALQGMTISAEGVNPFGSPQQPDNSWVTHLHGGEIPPSTDGFAELWFGNQITSAIFNTAPGKLVNPPFEAPVSQTSPLIELRRPVGNAAVYTYPMVQEEATIWFHDHTLGKTHHNVIAGPAGFFPVKDPTKHGAVTAGACAAGSDCSYTWLDPVTEPRTMLLAANALAAGVPAADVTFPTYDLFMAVQDRAFNDDGSINFSNGLGQTFLPPPLTPGTTPVTNGVNPLVHPTWVPEYFGDYALVNGVVWPKKTVESGWYRMRIVDGSDSRCYNFGFQGGALNALPPAPGANVKFNTPFWVIANDQGYLGAPVAAPGNQLTMCPGERYEILVNFAAVPGAVANGPATLYMVNNASAPFPGPGFAPQQGFTPHMNVIMRFDVSTVQGVKSCGATTGGRLPTPIAPATLTWNPANMAANLARSAIGYYTNICMPANPALQVDPSFVNIRPAYPIAAGSIVRQVYLNERVDGVTLTPLGMQLNGVPFEYKVTETPKVGDREVWQFINLTVDAHPMHPHLVKHQIVARQNLNVGKYKAALCGSATCQPGTAPGGEMQVVPDVNGVGFLGAIPKAGLSASIAASVEGGWKDASQVPPGMVTTIVADWLPRWAGSGSAANPAGTPNAPGTAGAAPLTCNGTCTGQGPPWTYETVTSGPYVWHCHINSHEDSEMMRTSLVVP